MRQRLNAMHALFILPSLSHTPITGAVLCQENKMTPLCVTRITKSHYAIIDLHRPNTNRRHRKLSSYRFFNQNESTVYLSMESSEYTPIHLLLVFFWTDSWKLNPRLIFHKCIVLDLLSCNPVINTA